LTRCFLGGLGCWPVFVDDSAEDLLPPDRGVEGDHGVRIVAGWVLVEALVWAVVVEVAYVLVEDGAGVLFVVDQHLVGAFFADAADEPFCIQLVRGARGGILIMSSPSEAKTASKLSVNLAARSWIRKRNVVI
jgi:hypothetical protein